MTLFFIVSHTHTHTRIGLLLFFPASRSETDPEETFTEFCLVCNEEICFFRYNLPERKHGTPFKPPQTVERLLKG